jgi:hypothetical protein
MLNEPDSIAHQVDHDLLQSLHIKVQLVSHRRDIGREMKLEVDS